MCEMPLTGYTFKNKEDIAPFVEKVGEGPTYQFCKELALQLNSYVACGYPEVDGDKYYNSAIVVDRKGNLILNHRKKHLFETDKTWASEGDTFNTFTLTNTKNQTLKFSIAICMDINPWEFQDMSKFELAEYCK